MEQDSLDQAELTLKDQMPAEDILVASLHR